MHLPTTFSLAEIAFNFALLWVGWVRFGLVLWIAVWLWGMFDYPADQPIGAVISYLLSYQLESKNLQSLEQLSNHFRCSSHFLCRITAGAANLHGKH